MARTLTMLDLVAAVSECTDSEEETVATVIHLVNTGRVRLCGNFAGATIAVDDAPWAGWAATA